MVIRRQMCRLGPFEESISQTDNTIAKKEGVHTKVKSQTIIFIYRKLVHSPNFSKAI